MQIFEFNSGMVLLVVFWFFMMGITIVSNKNTKTNRESFLVANRNMNLLKGSFSIAASWIWAPALFISSQKAFQQGIAGVFWFTVPNILALIIFGFLAVKIRELMPNGFTLPQYIQKRFDTKNHIVYIIMFLGLQVCSVAVQLLAGASVIHGITGIPIFISTITLSLTFLSYSLISGLKASIITDFLQMILILFTCIIIVPLVLIQDGSIEALKLGLGGFSGDFKNVFNNEVAFNFGIIVTIGLLAGPIGDQQHWQRAFALKKGLVKEAYFLSGFIFGLVPILLSILGFIAAGLVINGSINVIDPQLSGIQVVATLLPKTLLVVFVFMLLSGLASTGDSALCASSSLVAIDIYQKYINLKADDKKIVRISRITMVVVTFLAIILALIPEMKILYLFLFYGTLRACNMMPTILSLYINRITSNALFSGIIVAIIFGLPLYIYGAMNQKPIISVIASVSIILLSSFIPIILSIKNKSK